jgi:hypothetical protein
MSLTYNTNIRKTKRVWETRAAMVATTGIVAETIGRESEAKRNGPKTLVFGEILEIVGDEKSRVIYHKKSTNKKAGNGKMRRLKRR